MEVIAIGEHERARYDAAVAASPLADVMQSWGWGEVKSRTGWDALRLLAVDGDRVRGACSVLRTTPARGVPPLLYAPRGPIVDPEDHDALAAMLEAIRARAGSAFLFKCDPAVTDPGPYERAGLKRVSAGAFGGTQPTTVMVLDLSPGPEKVFEGFKSKWRYNVRLAERKGVTVRPGTRADLPAWHAIYRDTAARDGFVGRALSYFEALHDELGDPFRLFVAEHDGVMLAGIIVLTMGERAIYVYGASSNEQRNLMPNHLLQWEAISWACRQGLRLYDFRGVSPVRDGRIVEPHLAGLNRFKEGFGARVVEYAGEFDLPLRPAWYRVWQVGMPLAMKARAAVRRSDDA